MYKETRYDITRYSDILFSYFRMVFPNDRHDNIRYRNAMLQNSPQIVGLFKRVAAVLSSKITYQSVDKTKERLYENIFKKSGISSFQLETYMNLMTHDTQAITVSRPVEYTLKCHNCGAEHDLNRQTNYATTLAISASDTKTRLVAKRVKMNPKENYVCEKCGVGTTFDLQMINGLSLVKKHGLVFHVHNQYYTYTRQNKYNHNIHQVYVDGARFREVYPDILNNESETPYLDIVDFSENMLLAILLGTYYTPSMEYTTVLRHPEFKSMGGGFSPLVLAVTILLRSGVLKRGQEADGLIKMDPQYLITPEGNGPSIASNQVTGQVIQDIIMESVQEAKTGNGNSVQYLPFKASASKLFADPRRTITSREINSEEGMGIVPLGLDESLLTGGIGQQLNPVILHTVSELLTFYTDQFSSFLNIKVAKLLAVIDRVYALGEEEELKLSRIDQAPGTLIDSEYKEFAQAGGAPLDPMYKRYGYKSMQEALEKRNEEAEQRMRMDKELASVEARIQEETFIADQARGSLTPEQLGKLDMQMKQQAEQMAEELFMMDDGLKRSELDKLSKQNFTLYAVVTMLLRDKQNLATQQAKAEVQGG